MGYKLPLAEITAGIRNSILLASITMLCAIPMFQCQFRYLAGSLFSQPPGEEQIFYLALCQAFILFGIAVLSSLVGFFYCRFLGLPGFGKRQDGLNWLGIGLGIGLALTPIFYYSCDMEIYQAAPELFPQSWPQAVWLVLGNALSQEVIARFGMLTIGIYLLKAMGYQGYPWPAVAAVALFGALGHYLFISKFSLDLKLTASQAGISMMATFLFQWFFGDVFIKHGLLAAIGVHFGAGVKPIVYALILI